MGSKQKQLKRKETKIIRDMYDNKPINENEAIAKRNICIILEKEGLQNEKD